MACTLFYGSNLILNYGFFDDVVSPANITIGVIEINNNGYEAHKYLYELKNSDDVQYNEDYKAYKEKYAIP